MARRSKKTIAGLRARREDRRLEAARRYAAGESRADVARHFGVSWRAAHAWFTAWQAGGCEALRSAGKPGPAPKFNAQHERQLVALLLQGPRAHGHDNELWSIPRVRRLIGEKLGLKCSASETWRLLRRMHWSSQKPKRRARERKEDKIKQWKERRWSQIAAEARAEGRTIVFVDESGLSQRPARKSTWAPAGQTPVLEFNFCWKKLSCIAGLTLSSLYFSLHEQSIKSAEVIAFVDHLRRRIGKPVLILWDGLRAHWSRAVKEHVAGLEGRVKLEQLPAYAPELNPVEYAWAYAKGTDLANFCPKDLAELNHAAIQVFKRIKRTPRYLRACWIQSELSLDNL